VYNAGFENISILQIAETVTQTIPAEIIVTPSNDPRSYRLSSKKLLATGFEPSYRVADAIAELTQAYNAGGLRMEDRWFNIKTMKTLTNLI
jgi:nucleoside-diphosphate-sugar epimerase